MTNERRLGIIKVGKLFVTGATLTGFLPFRALLACMRMKRGATIGWPEPTIGCTKRWNITVGTADKRITHGMSCTRPVNIAGAPITVGGTKMNTGGTPTATGTMSTGAHTEGLA